MAWDIDWRWTFISSGIEQNLRSSYQDTNVNGFDYLRNIVHLPFYLQSQGLHIQQVDVPSSSHTGQGESPSKPQRVRLLYHSSVCWVVINLFNPWLPWLHMCGSINANRQLLHMCDFNIVGFMTLEVLHMCSPSSVHQSVISIYSLDWRILFLWFFFF